MCTPRGSVHRMSHPACHILLRAKPVTLGMRIALFLAHEAHAAGKDLGRGSDVHRYFGGDSLGLHCRRTTDRTKRQSRVLPHDDRVAPVADAKTSGTRIYTGAAASRPSISRLITCGSFPRYTLVDEASLSVPDRARMYGQRMRQYKFLCA